MLDSLELSESASSSEFFVMDDAPTSNRVSVHLTRATLRPELELLTEVIEPKNAIASQQNLLLEAFTSSARIRLRGVGRLNTLQCEVLADVQRTGTLCLPARRLAEIVRHLPDDKFTLTVEGEHATIKSGKSRCKLNASDTKDFPELRANAEPIGYLPGAVLLTMIRLALFAAARNAEGRYALEGAQLTIGPDGTRLIATDGHRLMCVTRRDLTRDEAVTLLIPRHSLHLVGKVFAPENDILFSRDEYRLFWRQGGRLLSSIQLEGQYPDCEALLTQEFANTLTVESHVFRAVIQRMSVLGSDSNGGDFGHIKFHFTPSAEAGYEMQCRDPQGSEGCEQFEPLNAAAEQAVTISFNGRFLAEFAKAMPDAPVTIGYNDDRNSVALWMTMEDGYELRYIVMPCVG